MLTLAAVAAIALLAWSFAATRDLPTYAGPISDHFDGERFFNLVSAGHGSGGDFLRMRLTTDYADWPEWVETPAAPPPAARLRPGELAATFVNHSTVLLQIGDRNLLTDPIWSRRTSPVDWAGPRRVHAPGIRFEDLPPIDHVLVSHAHYDHLDLPTLRRLAGSHQPAVWAGLGVGEWLVRRGVEPTRSVDWWQTVELGPDLRLTFTPVQHWSNRGFRDRNRSLWGGFVIEHAGRTVFFAGDTAAGPHFELIRHRFGPIDLAMLPIGAYAPPWFMRSAHLDPEEAVAAHRELEAQRSMAIHFGCFQLSQEAREEPGERLARARTAAGLPAGDFIVPAVGETLRVPAAIE